ncbi:MAG: hypothetical protein II968_00930 [Selenomonadaceae bacterium]|nr:hypothetical protein [Selenomonadaceae bacterium]
MIAGAEMTNTGLQKSVKAVNTQKEIAKVAGVSHDTIAKVEKIEQQAERLQTMAKNQEAVQSAMAKAKEKCWLASKLQTVPDICP